MNSNDFPILSKSRKTTWCSTKVRLGSAPGFAMWHYQATPNRKLTTSPKEFRMRMLLSNEGEMDAGHQKRQMPIINLKRNSHQEAMARLSILKRF